MKYLNKQVGFSLVELSVVLAVIGITISGALVIATKKTISDKIEETNYKMDAIERAMDAYLAQYQRLPCVSEGDIDKQDSDFGWEDGLPTVNSGNGQCQKDTSDGNYESGSVHYGGVPTKDLKIPDEYMFDGWGRRFSYVIDARFANSGPEFNESRLPLANTADPECDPTPTTRCTNPLCDGQGGGNNSACFRYQENGSITVVDAAAQDRTTKAVYVLISHGQNGFGAWPNVGGARLTASTDADEQENAGDDAAGPFNTVFVQKDETQTFDDIVRYRTKWQIIEDANLIRDPDLCISAKDVVEDIGVNENEFVDACDGLVGDLALPPNHTVCEQMAQQIYQWCLDM